MPETGIGFFTDVGGSYFLSRVKDNISLGLFLGITGYRLKAKDLVKWGVATHYIPEERMSKFYSEMSAKVDRKKATSEIFNIVNQFSELDANN